MFKLFNATRLYDKTKNLSDNFIAMCSLTWFKQDSAATQKLKEIIHECHFTNDDKTTGLDYQTRSQKRRQQLAKLETVRLAIEEWKSARENVSSRVELVKGFEVRVKEHQRQIVWEDWNENNSPINTSDRSWSNPVWDKNFKYHDYLPNSLKEIFYSLKKYAMPKPPEGVSIQL